MNYNAIMRIPRFYCPDISSDVLEIHDQKIIHHLIKVLRARQGQSIVLFDGNGKTFECEIKEIEKNKIKLDLLDSHNLKKKNIIIQRMVLSRATLTHLIISKLIISFLEIILKLAILEQTF